MSILIWAETSAGVRPGSPGGVPAWEASREIFERAGSEGHVSELVDRVLQRARPLREALIALSSAGCVIKLDVVGPGISFDAAAVEFLAAMRAAVDVDQYVEFE